MLTYYLSKYNIMKGDNHMYGYGCGCGYGGGEWIWILIIIFIIFFIFFNNGHNCINNSPRNY